MSSETLRAVRLGGSVVDVTIAAGKIARIVPSAGPAEAVILPPLADVHVHLDKTHSVHRTGTEIGSLADAIDRVAADKACWTAEDIRARAGRGLAEAERNGIVAVRSHVDWADATRPLAWDVLGDLARDWEGRVAVQRAALIPLDLFGDPDFGPKVAGKLAASGGVLGAFVLRNEHLPSKLEQVFALAVCHDLALDFHVDETLDRAATGFDIIVELTRRHHLAGRVVCGHACALAVRPEHEVARLLEAASAAGVALTVLPTTNGYLQDARPGRTPRLRGLAPLQEARAAGMEVCIALDNVRDGFYPYGEYDLLDAFRMACLTAHLDPETWCDSITTIPARVMGRNAPSLIAGAPADFVLIGAPSLTEFITRAQAPRQVWRAGRPLAVPFDLRCIA